MQRNINGAHTKKSDLVRLLRTYNVHVAALQETKLPKEPTNQGQQQRQKTPFSISGYECIRSDRINRSGGGILFLINSGIRYRRRNIEYLGRSQLNAIEICLPDKEILIVNGYDPDYSELVLQGITDAIEQITFVFVLGDFNVKS